ncbi:hypothetical protein I4F81_004824 [Pyropia yezoensis]|uniref:Uncharacterized protein n=1 Tax=Pyropia yezoensis TaxID=2788 RepID=A0ACC3BWZ3_PYRYE|nr:hypothetical protein I4F81_004824 [Neopyropia yezoensis]
MRVRHARRMEGHSRKGNLRTELEAHWARPRHACRSCNRRRAPPPPAVGAPRGGGRCGAPFAWPSPPPSPPFGWPRLTAAAPPTRAVALRARGCGQAWRRWLAAGSSVVHPGRGGGSVHGGGVGGEAKGGGGGEGGYRGLGALSARRDRCCRLAGGHPTRGGCWCRRGWWWGWGEVAAAAPLRAGEPTAAGEVSLLATLRGGLRRVAGVQERPAAVVSRWSAHLLITRHSYSHHTPTSPPQQLVRTTSGFNTTPPPPPRRQRRQPFRKTARLGPFSQTLFQDGVLPQGHRRGRRGHRRGTGGGGRCRCPRRRCHRPHVQAPVWGWRWWRRWWRRRQQPGWRRRRRQQQPWWRRPRRRQQPWWWWRQQPWRPRWRRRWRRPWPPGWWWWRWRRRRWQQQPRPWRRRRRWRQQRRPWRRRWVRRWWVRQPRRCPRWDQQRWARRGRGQQRGPWRGWGQQRWPRWGRLLWRRPPRWPRHRPHLLPCGRGWRRQRRWGWWRQQRWWPRWWGRRWQQRWPCRRWGRGWRQQRRRPRGWGWWEWGWGRQQRQRRLRGEQLVGRPWVWRRRAGGGAIPPDPPHPPRANGADAHPRGRGVRLCRRRLCRRAGVPHGRRRRRRGRHLPCVRAPVRGVWGGGGAVLGRVHVRGGGVPGGAVRGVRRCRTRVGWWLGGGAASRRAAVAWWHPPNSCWGRVTDGAGRMGVLPLPCGGDARGVAGACVAVGLCRGGAVHSSPRLRAGGGSSAQPVMCICPLRRAWLGGLAGGSGWVARVGLHKAGRAGKPRRARAPSSWNQRKAAGFLFILCVPWTH